MLTVVCVLSKPHRTAPWTSYTQEHVERLADMVKKHMEQPYEFACVDDSPYPGFWAKLNLFEPGRFSGRVLYLDLDVTVVGGLDAFADYPAPFVAVRDWLTGSINSSIIAWDAGRVGQRIWRNFKPETMTRYPGDQEWIQSQALVSKFPSRWTPSFKLTLDGKHDTPKGARVIVYHGHPRPWEVE